ncbi:hypothetical protein IW492_08650 [Enterococcus sp. BWB1-3]|nr:hypothetical protein [Enterococcus sp. BWB1-3]
MFNGKNALLIRGLIGCSLSAAGSILAALDWIAWASLLLTLCGIGASASAAVWAYRATIAATARRAGRYAAMAL